MLQSKCFLCGQSYTPKGYGQKFCQDCREDRYCNYRDIQWARAFRHFWENTQLDQDGNRTTKPRPKPPDSAFVEFDKFL